MLERTKLQRDLTWLGRGAAISHTLSWRFYFSQPLFFVRSRNSCVHLIQLLPLRCKLSCVEAASCPRSEPTKSGKASASIGLAPGEKVIEFKTTATERRKNK